MVYPFQCLLERRRRKFKSTRLNLEDVTIGSFESIFKMIKRIFDENVFETNR